MEKFESIINPSISDTLLDVGGYPNTWTARPQRTKRIDCLNIHDVHWEALDYPNHQINTVIGDGCSLEYNDNSFDILFSNSVIEHVGDWENQKRFAAEACRVARKIWVQTPAFECPIEPHFLAPFVHWLPVRIRRRVLRRFTLWGWIEKPSKEAIEEAIAFTQLLSKKRFRELFPDCTIITERLFFLFPKSYTAYRND